MTKLYAQLYAQLYDHLYDHLYVQLYDHLYVQLHDQLYNQLDAQLYEQLDAQLYAHLYYQLEEELDFRKREPMTEDEKKAQVKSLLEDTKFHHLQKLAYFGIATRAEKSALRKLYQKEHAESVARIKKGNTW